MARAAPTLLFAALLATGSPALAEHSHEEHPSPSEVEYLSFAQALRAGARAAPDVAAHARVETAAQQAVQVSHPLLTQLPQVQAQIGPRVSAGQATPEVIVTALQSFSLLHAGKAQERAARAEETAVSGEVRALRLRAAERAGQAWIALALAEERLRLRQLVVTELERQLAFAQARAEVGEGLALDVAMAQAELARARSAALQAEGDHYDAAKQLSLATGRPAVTEIEVKGGLSETEPILGACVRKTISSSHPELEFAQKRAAAAEADVAYFAVQQAPTFALGVQYQREGTGDQIATLVAQVPLPFFRPWKYQEARQMIIVERDRALVTVQRASLESELERAQHECSHAEAVLSSLQSTAIGPHEDMLRLAEATYKGGTEDITRLVWARQRLTLLFEEIAAATAALDEARLRHARVSGELLGAIE